MKTYYMPLWKFEEKYYLTSDLDLELYHKPFKQISLNQCYEAFGRFEFWIYESKEEAIKSVTYNKLSKVALLSKSCIKICVAKVRFNKKDGIKHYGNDAVLGCQYIKVLDLVNIDDVLKYDSSDKIIVHYKAKKDVLKINDNNEIVYCKGKDIKYNKNDIDNVEIGYIEYEKDKTICKVTEKDGHKNDIDVTDRVDNNFYNKAYIATNGVDTKQYFYDKENNIKAIINMSVCDEYEVSAIKHTFEYFDKSNKLFEYCCLHKMGISGYRHDLHKNYYEEKNN